MTVNTYRASSHIKYDVGKGRRRKKKNEIKKERERSGEREAVKRIHREREKKNVSYKKGKSTDFRNGSGTVRKSTKKKTDKSW